MAKNAAIEQFGDLSFTYAVRFGPLCHRRKHETPHRPE